MRPILVCHGMRVAPSYSQGELPAWVSCARPADGQVVGPIGRPHRLVYPNGSAWPLLAPVEEGNAPPVRATAPLWERGPIGQGAVRLHGVVVQPPPFDPDLGLLQGGADLPIQ